MLEVLICTIILAVLINRAEDEAKEAENGDEEELTPL